MQTATQTDAINADNTKPPLNLGFYSTENWVRPEHVERYEAMSTGLQTKFRPFGVQINVDYDASHRGLACLRQMLEARLALARLKKAHPPEPDVRDLVPDTALNVHTMICRCGSGLRFKKCCGDTQGPPPLMLFRAARVSKRSNTRRFKRPKLLENRIYCSQKRRGHLPPPEPSSFCKRIPQKRGARMGRGTSGTAV
jgi:hypothetical protein